MISPGTVNVFHDSRSEIRLRRLYIRLFVYNLTSKHVPNKLISHLLHKQATNSQYGYALLTTIVIHFIVFSILIG